MGKYAEMRSTLLVNALRQLDEENQLGLCRDILERIPDGVNKLFHLSNVSGSLPFKPCGEGDNICNCKSADECGYKVGNDR